MKEGPDMTHEIIDEVLNLRDEDYDMNAVWEPKTYVRLVIEDLGGRRFLLDGPFQVKMDGPEIVLKTVEG